jgi:signal transduction histidine kinase
VDRPKRLTAALELLELGIDPAGVPADAMRRIRILGIATLALCALGVPAALEYWHVGLSDVSLALGLGMGAALANLALLRWSRRPALCGHLGVGLLGAVLIAANLASGGFYDPNFAWFYVLPLAAAVLLDLRGAWIWLGLTLLAVLGFWSLHELGTPLPNRIPEAMRGGQALFSRVAAILSLGFIASSFVLGQRRAERGLAEANRELRRESAYVQLLEHAAVASNEAVSLDGAMREGLKRICTTMGWPCGHIYLAGEGGILRTSGAFFLEDAQHFEALLEKTLQTTFRAGEGMPGRALAGGCPQALHELADVSRPRAGLALKLGLNTAFAIPVLAFGRVVAVLEFASRERLQPNQRLLEVLAHVGIQIGRVAERTAFQERLRQSQKMEAVGRLAAGVAHEINNPMAYVRSNLNQLHSEWDDLRADLEKLDAGPAAAAHRDVCEELIEQSLEGVERTISIVRDMKEFSHMGGGGGEFADLREIVDGALRVASSRARPGVRVELQHADDVPPVVCAADQLRQVFVNLAVNAIEAVGDSGCVRVTSLRDGDHGVVRIEDDGPGMSQATRERLFDPFFTTKPAGEGTGLGLSISYEIVRGHGGEIRVQTAPGSGTLMEVRIPVEGSMTTRSKRT